MKLTAFAAGLMLMLSSCSKDDISVSNPSTPTATPVAASTMLNVSYGSDPLQKMDIYLPANRSTASTKLVIMIHGGSWTAGDKTDLTGFVDTIQRRLPGYAVININYRLASFAGNTFPTQETDVKTAVDLIYSKRAEYLISDKFVLMGVSAGSHLALLQSYKNASPSVKAVVDFFGPNDMADMYNNPASSSAPAAGIAFLLNGTPATNASLYASSSPITYVVPQSPPTIIFHGGADPLVRYQQSEALRDKLVLKGVPQQYVFYPTEGHGWTGANLVDSFNKLQDFLNIYVQ
jgi:acetyl esterase/lipase